MWAAGLPFPAAHNDECRQVLDTHVGGTLHMSRAAWPHMVASGCGRIIDTCSDALFDDTGLSVYAVGKGAVLGLTTSLAAEAARHGIKVNAAVPIVGTHTSLEAVQGDEQMNRLLTSMRMSALGVSGARASGTVVPGRHGCRGPRLTGVGTRRSLASRGILAKPPVW
ncbi:SDR family oxidoreductase [Streptomyces sp. MMG1121]|uniref:SDR family oxidoreductase n=1 Tax=Streptomyces sp. MMG1121 TaxID=1415544 RepID=UPI00227729A9|nr:SDR family oxidoreductase [Streptomyces sp. MMG1121]